MTIDIGQVAVKIAGRDSGRIGIVVDILKGNYVLIDGNTRRRKCSLNHLELIPQVLKIKKGAEHSAVVSALKDAGLYIEKAKPKFQKENKSKSKVGKPKKKLFGGKKEKVSKKEKPKAKVKKEKNTNK